MKHESYIFRRIAILPTPSSKESRRNETNPTVFQPLHHESKKNVRNARQEDKLATPARDGWRVFFGRRRRRIETVKMREEIACFFMVCLLREIYKFYRFSFDH